MSQNSLFLCLTHLLWAHNWELCTVLVMITIKISPKLFLHSGSLPSLNCSSVAFSFCSPFVSALKTLQLFCPSSFFCQPLSPLFTHYFHSRSYLTTLEDGAGRNSWWLCLSWECKWFRLFRSKNHSPPLSTALFLYWFKYSVICIVSTFPQLKGLICF